MTWRGGGLGGGQDALVENRTREVEKKLKDAEKLLKDQKLKAYINPELSAVEKEKGNALVKDGKFVEAKVGALRAAVLRALCLRRGRGAGSRAACEVLTCGVRGAGGGGNRRRTTRRSVATPKTTPSTATEPSATLN